MLGLRHGMVSTPQGRFDRGNRQLHSRPTPKPVICQRKGIHIHQSYHEDVHPIEAQCSPKGGQEGGMTPTWPMDESRYSRRPPCQGPLPKVYHPRDTDHHR